MKRIVFFISFLSFVLYAQGNISKYKVEYTYYTPDDYKIAKDTLQSYLLFNDNESLYRVAKKEYDPNTLDYNEKDELVGDVINFEDEVYKDWNANLMLSNSFILYQKGVTLKQPLDDFSVLSVDNEKTKKILGYNCKYARVKYKDRIYDVYFTPEIKTHFGPWKFHGFDGLILEVKEKGGALALQAKSIQKKKEDITPKLKQEYAQTWDETVQKANILYSQHRQRLMRCCSKNPTIATFGSLEIYDLNPNVFYEITYDRFITFKKRNTFEKSLITQFVLVTSPYESKYEYIEKLFNFQEQKRSFGFVAEKHLLYKNLTDSILKQQKDLDKRYLIADKIPMLKWKLTGEEKEMLGYKVYKAVAEQGNIRVEAWYTKQIPIPNGPDKYSYLPGLILRVEACRTEGEVAETDYYVAKKIEKIEEYTFEKPSKGKEISLKEYDKIQRDLFNRKMEMLRSNGVDTED